MKLILGSKSQGRRDVLTSAGYEFEVLTADFDEKSIRDSDPEKLVLKLATAKAEAILPKVSEPAILIAADQVVVCNGVILEKPENEDQAREYLRGYAAHPMETVSGLVVINTQTGKRVEGIDIAKVYFKPIPEDIISASIADGRVMHCSGAMRCEDEPLSLYVERFEGTKDSTSGMPLVLLKRLIDEVSK